MGSIILVYEHAKKPDILYYIYQSALYHRNHAFGTRDPRLIIEIKFEAQDLSGAVQLIDDLGYRVYVIQSI